MKKQQNPFLLIAMAAASNVGVTLTAKQCKKLMKNDYVYSEAVEAIPLKTVWDKILNDPQTCHFGHFRKLAEHFNIVQ